MMLRTSFRGGIAVLVNCYMDFGAQRTSQSRVSREGALTALHMPRADVFSELLLIVCRGQSSARTAYCWAGKTVCSQESCPQGRQPNSSDGRFHGHSSSLCAACAQGPWGVQEWEHFLHIFAAQCLILLVVFTDI